MITFIIPVYNVSAYLRECLDSLLMQTCSEWEAVCVDDGSVDNSYDILQEYAKRDARFKVIRSSNAGTFNARRRGVEKSNGEWISFLDPDDWIRPEFCEVLLNKLKRVKCDILQCGVEILETTDRTKAQRQISEYYFNPNVKRLNGRLSDLAYCNRRIGWNLIYRVFKAEMIVPLFAKMPDVYVINETDALAFYWIARTAKSFYRIKDRLYVYRYGVGISTCKKYLLSQYERTLGKFDGLEQCPFGDEWAFLSMSFRMMDNSFKAGMSRLEIRSRGKGLRMLEKKVGAEYFLDYMALRFGGNASELIAELEGTDFFTPTPPRPIKRIGIHYYRINRGGVQRVMLQIVDRFIKNGREVVLFIEEPPGEDAFELPQGIKIVFVPRSLGRKALNASARMKEMVRMLREEKIDLWYTHAYSSPMLIWDLLVCNRVQSIPTVVHYHTAFTTPLHYRVQSQLFELQTSLMSFADRVLTLRKVDAAYFAMHGARSCYMPNSMPAECAVAKQKALLPEEARTLVLWCGRDSWEKNPEDARKIFRLLKKRRPDVKTVILTGKATNPYEYFSKASVFLNTSEMDGFSMVSLEALAHGVPIVSYTLGNLELYRNNPAVIQVPQGDIGAAVEALDKLLDSPNLDDLRIIAKRSTDWIEQFDFAAVWKQLLSDIENGVLPETYPIPDELKRRVEEEEMEAKRFRDKNVQNRKKAFIRWYIKRVIELMHKMPGYFRENGLRCTCIRVFEKLAAAVRK